MKNILGRKQALEYLRKSGGSAEDIGRLESKCKVVWSCDDSTLPPGWKTRQVNQSFLKKENLVW